ncbi:MAG: peptidylprolyl isomerase [Alphaproteobacteria bacterium]|nr:peptidylprolyl isomerase [Alphaproteobacteria bacterium]
MTRLARALLGGLLLTGAVGVSALSAPARADVVDRVAAVVNEEVITLSEIYDLGADYIAQIAPGALPGSPARRSAELEVLESLIQRRLVTQELQRLGMDVTSEQLERAIDDVARQNGLDRSELRREVERSGLPWSVYREELQENIRQMQFNQVVLQPRVAYSEDELQDLYKRRVRGLVGATSRTLHAIYIKWPEGATPEDKAALAQRMADYKARYDAGEPWAALVADASDSVLASAGGVLGTFQKGESVAEIDGPAFSVGVGEVTQPIAVTNGMLLIRVASSSKGEPPSFEAVRMDLEQELFQTKLEQELALWYTQARRQASVKVLLEQP